MCVCDYVCIFLSPSFSLSLSLSLCLYIYIYIHPCPPVHCGKRNSLAFSCTSFCGFSSS